MPISGRFKVFANTKISMKTDNLHQNLAPEIYTQFIIKQTKSRLREFPQRWLFVCS